MDNTNSAVTAAIDVGYGHTKYSWIKNGQIAIGSIPSIAPLIGSASRRNGNGIHLPGSVLKKRNTVTVEVDANLYEVGPEASMATDSMYARQLDAEYCMSAPYMALLRGALAMMGLTKIDLLVVGLPLTNFAKYRGALQKKIVGEHQVPIAGKLETVVIKEVVTLPQVVGTLLDQAISNRQILDRNHTSLVIDPGFFTLDWMVSRGQVPVESRSHAIEGGVSFVLKEIGQQITRSHHLSQGIKDLALLETAVTEKKMWLFDSEVSIENEIAHGQAKAGQLVREIVSGVGNSSDLRLIVLAGGGAHLFETAVREAFPRNKLVVADDPMYSNVRGYLAAGRQVLAARGKATV